MNKIACVDLDGTLAHYDDWKGEEHFGNPIEGAASAMVKLKEKGWTIIVFTTRSNKKAIKGFLDENNIVFDHINENPHQPENAIGGKPFADVYIDDRAISFYGKWDETLERVENFQPWKKTKETVNLKAEYCNDFLKNDFNQSYQQLRHYDSLNWEITKFSILELLVGIASVWAIYSFAKDTDNSNTYVAMNYSWIIPSILGVSYIFSILASFLISRNRVYFAKVARYINEHRDFAFKENLTGFKNLSKFYTNPNFPTAFDKWSTQLVCLYVIQVVSSIMFGALVYGMISIKSSNFCLTIGFSLFSGLISIVVNLWVYISYMKNQDSKLGNASH
jgi:hypothetical protein